MKVELRENDIVIVIPRDLIPQRSKTGKSLIVASTHGNIKTDARIDGKPLTVSVNAYITA